MGKVNVCLKRSYVIVISLIAVASALLLGGTLFNHGYYHQNEEVEETLLTAIHAMYIISTITLALTITGVYGACKEKKWALIVMAEGLKMQYLRKLPLNNATESFIDTMDDIQIHLQCCGLDQGYLDWGYHIPQSCLCGEESTNPCVAAPRDSNLFEHVVDDQPIMIYNESCIPLLIAHQMESMHTLCGIILGITLLWILSVVLCIFILCRLNKKEDIPVVVYSPQAKAGNYTALTDAAEYT
ncbi:tetraspanin-8-like isoform X2 [Sander vitreus]